MEFKEMVKSADWKQEKHVPVIDIVGEVKKEEAVNINVSVGKEIAHPNTTAHHIDWIELYFMPEGGKFTYLIGRYEFAAHGSSAEGPDTSTVYSMPEVNVKFKTEKPGTLTALSYCNIHGLWTSSAELKI